MVYALCGQSGVSFCFTDLKDNLKRNIWFSRSNNFRPRFKFLKLVLFSEFDVQVTVRRDKFL